MDWIPGHQKGKTSAELAEEKENRTRESESSFLSRTEGSGLRAAGRTRGLDAQRTKERLMKHTWGTPPSGRPPEGSSGSGLLHTRQLAKKPALEVDGPVRSRQEQRCVKW